MDTLDELIQEFAQEDGNDDDYSTGTVSLWRKRRLRRLLAALEICATGDEDDDLHS